ncbi:hypothetical protein BaRGS_00033051, partial [Batillaria attramentaria]
MEITTYRKKRTVAWEDEDCLCRLNTKVTEQTGREQFQLSSHSHTHTLPFATRLRRKHSNVIVEIVKTTKMGATARGKYATKLFVILQVLLCVHADAP